MSPTRSTTIYASSSSARSCNRKLFTPPRSGRKPAGTALRTTVDPIPEHINFPGFPTFRSSQSIFAAFLASLPEPTRDTAIITQEMFNRIWDQLHARPDTKEAMLFQLWVKSSFRLVQTTSGSDGSGDTSSPVPEVLSRSAERAKQAGALTVVVHNDQPIVILEQLYEVLCFGHYEAKHGDLERTYETLCQHFSYVPKAVVDMFVKACPTCHPRPLRQSRKSRPPKKKSLVEERPVPVFDYSFFAPDGTFKGLPRPRTSAWTYNAKPIGSVPIFGSTLSSLSRSSSSGSSNARMSGTSSSASERSLDMSREPSPYLSSLKDRRCDNHSPRTAYNETAPLRRLSTTNRRSKTPGIVPLLDADFGSAMRKTQSDTSSASGGPRYSSALYVLPPIRLGFEAKDRHASTPDKASLASSTSTGPYQRPLRKRPTIRLESLSSLNLREYRTSGSLSCVQSPLYAPRSSLKSGYMMERANSEGSRSSRSSTYSTFSTMPMSADSSCSEGSTIETLEVLKGGEGSSTAGGQELWMSSLHSMDIGTP